MVGIQRHAALGLLADGLHHAGPRLAAEVVDQVWPMCNGRQLRRFEPQVQALARELGRSVRLFDGDQGLRDARAALQLLEEAAQQDPTRSKRALRTFAGQLSSTAELLLARAGADRPGSLDELAQVRQLVDADMTPAAAQQLLDVLPPAVLTDEASSALLGLDSAEHVLELAETARDVIERRARDAARERLGILGLQLRREDPAAAAQLRALALDVFDADPNTVPPRGWSRLVDLLELDPAGRVLDGPRAAPSDAQRDLLDIARRGAARSRPSQTSATTEWFFEQWRAGLRSRGGVDGAPLEPAGIPLDARSVLRRLESDPLQDAELLQTARHRLGAADRLRHDVATARHRLGQDPDAPRTMLRRLDPARISSIPADDLRFIGGLLDLDDAARPPWMRAGTNADHAQFARSALLAERRIRNNPTWAGYKHLAEWIDQVAIDDAVAAHPGGAPGWVADLLVDRAEPAAAAALGRVSVLRTHLLPVDLSDAARLEVLSLGPRFASDQLGRHRTTPRAWIEAVLAALDALPPESTPLERDLVERLRTAGVDNLRRMDPATSDTAIAFVDFAEVGAMGADLAVLARLVDDTARGGLAW